MTSSAITRRIIILMLFMTLSLLQLPQCQAAGHVQQNLLTKPVTTRANLHIPSTFREDEVDGFWLSGLSSAPQQAPDVLGIAWTQVPNSWFGTVWRITLSSSSGLIPITQMPQNGQGFLQNRQVLELASLAPAPGHTYTVQLSYDPGTGATAVLIHDETAAQTVFEDEWQLLPCTMPVFVLDRALLDATAQIAHTPVLELIETLDHFAPTRIYWQIVDASTSAAPVMQMLRRDKKVALELDTHWTKLPGHLQLRICDSEKQLYSIAISKLGRGAQTPLTLRDLAAGVYHFVLEYVEGEHVITLGERAYPVGIVQANLQNVRVQQLGSERAVLSGTLRLQADGPVSAVQMGLFAELDSLGFTVDAAKMEGKISSGEITTTPIQQWVLPQIDKTRIDLPFTAEVDLPPAVRTPYQLVQLTLRPQLQADAQLEAVPYTQRLRLTPINPPPQTADTDGLRVMSYNIRIGRGMDDVIDLQRIADEIAYSGADIIGLNEVDRLTTRSGWVDQAAELAKMLGMHSAFGANINFQGGQYGNALLSRYPIKSAVNTHLPLLSNERRGILHAEIDYAGTTIHFLVTHLGLTTEESTQQLQQIVKMTETITGPVILVGDFNRRAGTELDPILHLNHLLQDAWVLGESLTATSGLTPVTPVYSNFVPDRRIDFIYISPAFEIKQAGDVFTINSLASDHRPVVAQLSLKEENQ